MPKLSIIIPCYNVAEYIDRCIDSIVNQTFGINNIRIICIDDASNDDTYNHLLKWEEKYPENIVIIHNETNKRQGYARNIALEYVDTEYITYIDADDFIDRNFVKVMIDVASTSLAEMVVCGHIRDYGKNIDLDCIKKTNISYKEVVVLEEMRADQIRFASSDPQVWGRVFRRDFIEKYALSFPEELTYEDNLWRAKLACSINHYCMMDYPLYHYFVNEESTIMTKDSMHHVDYLTVQLLKWEYMNSKGHYEKYPDAVEFDFLHNCYLDFLKLISYRYSEPQYPMFRLLREIVSSRIDEPERNKYYDKGFTEFQKILLGFIKMKVTKEEFIEMTSLIKKNGI